MRIDLFVCAAAVAVMMPAAALADDPRDPAMRSGAARARDSETIRRLNLQELARVQERDARFAEGWRAARDGGSSVSVDAQYAGRSRNYERAVAAYDHDRAIYEQEMEQWQRNVAACRAGHYSVCAAGR